MIREPCGSWIMTQCTSSKNVTQDGQEVNIALKKTKILSPSESIYLTEFDPTSNSLWTIFFPVQRYTWQVKILWHNFPEAILQYYFRSYQFYFETKRKSKRYWETAHLVLRGSSAAPIHRKSNNFHNFRNILIVSCSK